jgi:hypothetical protein
MMALKVEAREPLVKLTDFGTSEYHMGFSAKFDKYSSSSYKTPECFKGSEPVDMVLSDIFWHDPLLLLLTSSLSLSFVLLVLALSLSFSLSRSRSSLSFSRSRSLPPLLFP